MMKVNEAAVLAKAFIKLRQTNKLTNPFNRIGGKMEDVFNKVTEIICNQLNIDKSAVTMDSEIVKDLGADSLDIIEMLMSFEDEYGISIPDDVSSNIKTVGDIVALIEKK